MNGLQYRVWTVKNDIKFRLGSRVHTIPWSLKRERELTLLLARWQELEPQTQETPDAQ